MIIQMGKNEETKTFLSFFFFFELIIKFYLYKYKVSIN